MRHDKIVGAGNPDYVLVENEAERVAREAVKVLKQSRARCKLAAIGTPTWTGKSGIAGAPPPKRFGKKETKSQSNPAPGGSFGKFNKADDDETAEPMSSNSLLQRMRTRNQRIQDDSDEEMDEETLVKEEIDEISSSNKELLDDIRIFVSFGAITDGQATTDEIVQQFRDRIDKQDNAKFKAMLRQICNFERDVNGIGVWKLRQEFVG